MNTEWDAKTVPLGSMLESCLNATSRRQQITSLLYCKNRPWIHQSLSYWPVEQPITAPAVILAQYNPHSANQSSESRALRAHTSSGGCQMPN